ncbi:hypothetical protein H4219_005200 [Mycoemilia scoparia]|uniref:K Homology domain-containing protein n=1 Tax=Mycoemilia scoparia TaxID=417184 RepID=A0A9W7ZUV3_9FUNG|nr:hypothetical protein H4219_005200 [Mycoemilia scoparia]
MIPEYSWQDSSIPSTQNVNDAGNDDGNQIDFSQQKQLTTSAQDFSGFSGHGTGNISLATDQFGQLQLGDLDSSLLQAGVIEALGLGYEQKQVEQQQQQQQQQQQGEDKQAVAGPSGKSAPKNNKKHFVSDIKSEEAFPSLGAANPVRQTPASKWGQMRSNDNTKKLPGSAMLAGKGKVEVSREVIDLPLAQSGPGNSAQDDNSTSISEAVNQIMKRTGTKIEVSRAVQLQTITFLVTGPKDNIAQARREIISNLSPKITAVVQVPAEARSFIVGTKGKTLQTIQNRTGTKITLPKMSDNAEAAELITDVTIYGETQGVSLAKAEILNIAEQKTSKKAIRVTQVPMNFYPLIAGVNGKNLKAWKKEFEDISIVVPNRPISSAPENSRLPTSTKDAISIVGNSKSVEALIQKLKALSEKLKSDLSSVPLTIPHQQHRFITGPKNSIVNNIMDTTGCVVDIPPASSSSNTITIYGPEQAVLKAIGLVMERANSSSIDIIDPTQFHRTERPVLYAQRALRYLLYRQKHLRAEKEFEVEVSVPSFATLIKAKEPREVQVEVIGKSADNVRAAVQSLSRFFHDLPPYHFNMVQIEPHLHEVVKGPKDTNLARMRDTKSIDLVFPPTASTNAINLPSSEILIVYEGFNPNIEKIRDSSEKEEAVRELIRSTISEVRTTSLGATDYTATILEIPSIYHLTLLGQKGNNIKDIRKAAKVEEGQTVVIEFGSLSQPTGSAPGSGQPSRASTPMTTGSDGFPQDSTSSSKSKKKKNKKKNAEAKVPPPKPLTENEVAVKGRSGVVERVAAELTKRYKKLKEYSDLHSFIEEVQVPSNMLSRVIGKGYANLNRIRGDKDIRIDVVEGNSGFTSRPGMAKIQIQGIRKEVEKAKADLRELIEHLEDQVTEIINIDSALHPALVGPKGRFVRRLEEKYVVFIRFPHSHSNETPNDSDDEYGPGIGVSSDKLRPNEIRIRGGRKGVESAKKELLDLADYEKEHAYTETIQVPGRFLRHILGRAGSRVNEIKDSTGARIDIGNHTPSAGADDDGEYEAASNEEVPVKLTGTKDAVREAKKQVQAIVKEQALQMDVKLNIPSKHHRYLIGTSGARIRDLIKECGGDADKAIGEKACRVQFPRQGVTTGPEADIVSIRGDRNVVKKLQAKIEALVAERERMITVTINVPVDQHRYIIGRGGQNLQNLQKAHSVEIHFTSSSREHSAKLGGAESQSSDPTSVTITGFPENCESAKNAMLVLVKDQKAVTVPFDVHRRIGGRSSILWKKIRTECDVTVDAPQKPDSVNKTPVLWILRGDKENIPKALEQIKKAIDKITNAHTERINVSSRLHRYIIGPRGSTISHIREQTDCEINVPKSDCAPEDREWVVITGDKEDIQRAVDMIEDAIENRA